MLIFRIYAVYILLGTRTNNIAQAMFINGPNKYITMLYQYLDFLIYESEKEKSEQDEINAATKAALQEVEEMKKNPNMGKTYNDVDVMMKELLA